MFTKHLIQRLSPTQREAVFSRLRCRANVAARVGSAYESRRADAVLGRFSLLSGVQ